MNNRKTVIRYVTLNCLIFVVAFVAGVALVKGSQWLADSGLPPWM